MSDKIVLNAVSRSDLGKGASRRLRHSDEVPAIVYGTSEPQSITLAHKDVWKAQGDDTFYASVLALMVDGVETPVIVKAMQRHPAKPVVMHIDFQRANDNTEVVLSVPLLFINADTCDAVKQRACTVKIDAKTIKILCLPRDIPTSITVDLQSVQPGIMHISDVVLPEGVKSVELALGKDHNAAIAQIKLPRVVAAVAAVTGKKGKK